MLIAIPPWSASRGKSPNCGGCTRGMTSPCARCGRIWMALQLGLTVNGEIKQTDATHHVFALLTVALAWQERWHWMKGWR